MTQDVQPLTWQKRTNLEEHQQFFTKINEIIDNLAPTVDEAEAAIARATAAIASANDAIATANAASAAADAAAQQAQTAAGTVAGYDTRMSAVESKNTQQDTAISALQTADAKNVKISGTHAIGDYAVLLTDNQTIYGEKRIMGRILERVCYVKNTTNAVSPVPMFRMDDLARDDRYMKAVLLITGRSTPTTLTEVVWDNNAINQTDVIGTQTNPFTIMSDTAGHYWLCITLVPNNTINAFALCCLRNAGFDLPVYPLITPVTPDMTGWTVISQ